MSNRIRLWDQPVTSRKKGEKTEADPDVSRRTRARSAAIRAQAAAPRTRVEEPVESESAVVDVTPPGEVEAGEWEGSPEGSGPSKRHRNRLPKKKRRRSSVSLCVSDEEAELLYAHAASMNRSLSEWARTVLFKAMGRPVPARYGRQTKVIERMKQKQQERDAATQQARAKKRVPPAE